MNSENVNISLQLFSCYYELGIAVEHLATSPCCSTIFLIYLSYEFFVNFLLMYEFCRGVRIFKNIAGVRIRTLVYEKKTLQHPEYPWPFGGLGPMSSRGPKFTKGIFSQLERGVLLTLS